MSSRPSAKGNRKATITDPNKTSSLPPPSGHISSSKGSRPSTSSVLYSSSSTSSKPSPNLVSSSKDSQPSKYPTNNSVSKNTSSSAQRSSDAPMPHSTTSSPSPKGLMAPSSHQKSSRPPDAHPVKSSALPADARVAPHEGAKIADHRNTAPTLATSTKPTHRRSPSSGYESLRPSVVPIARTSGRTSSQLLSRHASVEVQSLSSPSNLYFIPGQNHPTFYPDDPYATTNGAYPNNRGRELSSTVRTHQPNGYQSDLKQRRSPSPSCEPYQSTGRSKYAPSISSGSVYSQCSSYLSTPVRGYKGDAVPPPLPLPRAGSHDLQSTSNKTRRYTDESVSSTPRYVQDFIQGNPVAPLKISKNPPPSVQVPRYQPTDSLPIREETVRKPTMASVPASTGVHRTKDLSHSTPRTPSRVRDPTPSSSAPSSGHTTQKPPNKPTSGERPSSSQEKSPSKSIHSGRIAQGKTYASNTPSPLSKEITDQKDQKGRGERPVLASMLPSQVPRASLLTQDPGLVRPKQLIDEAYHNRENAKLQALCGYMAVYLSRMVGQIVLSASEDQLEDPTFRMLASCIDTMGQFAVMTIGSFLPGSDGSQDTQRDNTYIAIAQLFDAVESLWSLIVDYRQRHRHPAPINPSSKDVNSSNSSIIEIITPEEIEELGRLPDHAPSVAKDKIKKHPLTWTTLFSFLNRNKKSARKGDRLTIDTGTNSSKHSMALAGSPTSSTQSTLVGSGGRTSEESRQVISALGHIPRSHYAVEDNRLVAGTFRALVTFITSEEGSADAEFYQKIMTGFRLFIPPEAFFAELKDRYLRHKWTLDSSSGYSKSGSKPVNTHPEFSPSGRVLQVLTDWLKQYWSRRHDDRVLDDMEEFLRSRLLKNQATESWAIQPILVLVAQRKSADTSERLERRLAHAKVASIEAIPLKRPPPNDFVIPNLAGFGDNLASALLCFDTPTGREQFARQLTMELSRRFQKLDPYDAVQYWRLPYGKRPTSDSEGVARIKRVTDFEGAFPYWVAHTIVSTVDLTERTRVVVFWLHVAMNCFEVQNFNCAATIYFALSMHVIVDLQQTIVPIPLDSKRIYHFLDQQFRSDNNHINYRQLIKTSRPPFLPLTAFIIQEVAAASAAAKCRQRKKDADIVSDAKHQSSATNDKVVNLKEYDTMTSIIQDLSEAKTVYLFQAVQSFSSWFVPQIKPWVSEGIAESTVLDEKLYDSAHKLKQSYIRSNLYAHRAWDVVSSGPTASSTLTILDDDAKYLSPQERTLKMKYMEDFMGYFKDKFKKAFTQSP